ncbi:MAG TPA: TonB-dependent receptor [Rhodocyclaceae bacterium]|nr:TonB-dependent receptor [Rhodocyclaceae bacterium]
MPKHPYRKGSLVCTLSMLGLLSSMRTFAADSPFFEDLPTVLTVSRLPQPVNEAPGAVTVLDGDFIRATGYRDLARVFRLVPGMQVGQERGDSQWVTYHGLGNNFPTEMQVLVDGRSVYSPSAFGGVDWSALPLSIDEIDRVEIMRGTNSVTYGANAFLGVINIITKHSAQEPVTRFKVTAGDSGIADVAATTDGHVGGMSVRVNATYTNDDGFEDLNDSRRMAVLSVRADYHVTPVDELMFRVGGSSGTQGLGYPTSLFNNNGLRDAHNNDYVLHTTWTHSSSIDNEWTVNLYRNHEQVKDEWTALVTPPFYPTVTYVPLNRDRQSTRDHLEVQNRFSPGKTTQLVWGAEARKDHIDAPFIYASGNPPDIDLFRGFSNLEWHFAPAWRANVGAAYERYSGEPTNLAPRAFINWQVDPGNTLRAGYARAYEQSSTYAKYGDVQAFDPATGTLLVRPYVPNPDIRQPRIDSTEIGYLGRFKPWATTLDVRLFNERIKDFMVRVPTNSAPVPALEPFIGSAIYTNIGETVTRRGIEYQLNTKPWRGGEWRFTHTIIERNGGGADIDNRTAPYTASLSWMQDWNAGWSSMLTALRMGPMSGGDGFVPIYNYTAPAYTTYDARIAYATRFDRHKIEYSLNGINLGKRHQEIADRSQQAAQALLGNFEPANFATRMVYFSVSLEM